MKKCVKKIPKYEGGTPAVTPSPTFYQDPNFYSQFGNFLGQQIDNVLQSKQGVTAGGVAKGALTGAATGAAIGSVVPGIGTAIGAGAGALIGGITSSIGHGGRVNQLTGDREVANGMVRWLGLGRDDHAVMEESNRIKSANISKTNTQHLLTNYYNNTPGAGSVNVLAAEGGIMRQPVLAKVSPGELRIDPITLKYEEIPGDGGKPNDDDNVTKILGEGEIIASNAEHMKMPNGKTPADNAKTILDSNMSEQLKKKMIKKLTNWQEANKTKPQEYGTLRAADGWDGIIESWDDYLKKTYTLSKDNAAQELNDFWGYDSKAGKYTNDWDKIIKYIGSNKDLKAKAIKDLSGLSYIGNGANAWDNIVKAAHDKNVRDVHRYFRQVGDDLVHNLHLIDYTPSHGVLINRIQEPFINKRRTKTNLSGATLINSYENSGANKKLTKATPEQLNASALHYSNLKWPDEKRSNKFGDVLDNLTGLAPSAAAMVGDYDYHVEQPLISPESRVPLNADPRPLFRAADETYSMGNYNFANLGGNTGANMAYGIQLAANRAKQYADALKWQQETNNNIIAHNVAIENDWGKRYDLAREKAIENTRANEAAADAQRDTRIKDAMGYYRDWQLTPFLKQYLSSGAYDKSIKRLG